MKFFKRQKKDNIELDEVYRLLKGYYRCSADEGYPFLFVSDDFLNTLHWTQKEIETKFDNKLVNMLHPEDRSRLEKDRDLLRNQYKVGTCQNVVFRLKGKDEYHWVSDCYLALKQDSSREILRMLQVLCWIKKKGQRSVTKCLQPLQWNIRL